jgi:hypothetical protein
MCPDRAQKDALGCVDSAKDKIDVNHVTPLYPELLFSSGLRKVLYKFWKHWATSKRRLL